jgi:hypothetical protein
VESDSRVGRRVPAPVLELAAAHPVATLGVTALMNSSAFYRNAADALGMPMR